MKSIKIFILILFVIVSLNCSEFMMSRGPVERLEKTLNFNQVNELKLSNVTGSITLIGWDKDQVEVNYKKTAKDKTTLDKLVVTTDNSNGRLTIDTDYPKRCRRCSVSYKIYLPKKMEKMYLSTVTGSINIEKISYVKSVVGKSVTGSVRAELSCKDAKFDLVTGRINLALNKIDDDGELDLSVTTGLIKIYAPEDFGADLDLRTTTGRVTTDFPVTTVGKLKRSRLRGKIGSGSASLKVRSVTGSIKILKNN